MKKFISAMVMLICVVGFAMEVYMLSFLQTIDIMSGRLNSRIWDYAVQPPFSIAFLITIAIFIIAELSFIYFSRNKSQRKNS